MEIGFVQNFPVFGEVEKNLSAVENSIQKLDASLLVLPELFSSGYQFKTRDEALSLSEKVPDGPTTRRLLSRTKKTKKLHIVFGICERFQGKLFNSAVLIGPGGFLGIYRKSHLFGREKSIFSPGDTGFEVFDIGEAKIGIVICYDWRFPECMRLLALKGADIICHPSNLVFPKAPDGMVTRSIENGVFSITADRVGVEQRVGGEKLTFVGKSQVVDPEGNVLVRAGEDEYETCTCTIDPLAARDKKRSSYNNLMADRREDLYSLKGGRTGS